MKQIILSAFVHREQECIGVYFAQDPVLDKAIRQCRYARWSRTRKCWYLPLGKESFEAISKAFNNLASLDRIALDEYLVARAKKAKPATADKKEAPVPVITVKKPTVKTAALMAVNAHVLPAMEQRLKLKAYSKSTIKTYLNEMRQLLQTLKNHAADLLTPEEMKRYLVYCFDKLKLSENTLHSRTNAMKFYYEQVLGREQFFWEIPRPKKPLQLPKLLNEDELRKLFNALTNKKHKAMLFTAYSAGLRVSELVNLKIADIDSKRMQLFIERAKGKKDRYVNLSPVLLDILRKYIAEYKPRPEIYLFESVETNTAYPTRTVQQIFSTAKSKAGIRKEVGIHSLRHSFATHLLDKGTDIRYIKDLLGHFNIKTTERYLHVSKQKLVNIISPLDDLNLKEGVDW